MNIVFVIAGLFIFMALLVMGGLVYYIIKKSTRKRSPEELASKRRWLKGMVDAKKRELNPWGARTFEDLTFCMMCRSSKTTERRLRGHVFSKAMDPIIGFERFEYGFKPVGYLRAASTAFDLFYELNDRTFTLYYNDEFLGKVRANGEIFDARGEKIGLAKHPEKISVQAAGMRFRLGDRAFPIVMNGRLLALLAVAPDYSDLVTETWFTINENNIGPLLVLHEEDPGLFNQSIMGLWSANFALSFTHECIFDYPVT